MQSSWAGLFGSAEIDGLEVIWLLVNIEVKLLYRPESDERRYLYEVSCR